MARPVTSETRSGTAEKVADPHRRYLDLGEAGVDRYYSPRRGYYSPAEAGGERDRFGLCLATLDGNVYAAGDADLPFALQSISKVFVHGVALAEHGRARVLERVGVEPSGDAFNSLAFDEHNNRPFNPMVNAGALAATDLVRGDGSNSPLDRILETLRCCAGNDGLEVDEQTLAAEVAGADRNRATA